MHPNGISFLRFEYPSALPDRRSPAIARHRRAADAGARLRRLACSTSSSSSRPDGDVRIVEVNGRMASQFAPLVKAVHGVSTYELQLGSGHRRHARPAAGPHRPGGVELPASHLRRRGRAVGARPDRGHPRGSATPMSRSWCVPASGCRRTTTTPPATGSRWSRWRPPIVTPCCRRFDEAAEMLQFELEPVTASVGR